ncbi:MAG: hypothetical protein HY360_18225 [Verrucomicrobia bacterium]|nr:hypothetical protein [Verrucomicrobiota bacterium]
MERARCTSSSIAARLGAPHDRLLVDDLNQARDYRFYIVQDALCLTGAQRGLIRAKLCARGHTVLWFYAPGLIDEERLSVEAMSDLIGLRLRHRETYGLHLRLRLTNRTHPYHAGVQPGTELVTLEGLDPLFLVDAPDATTLGCGGDVHDTSPAFAVKRLADWTSVYCSVPALPPLVIRNIAREAGVHIYSDMNDFVAANNWLLTVCASCDGPRTIHLPRKATVIDAMTDAVVARATDHFEATMKYGETGIWKME